MKKLLIPVLAAGAFALSSCDVDQTREMKVPKVDVDVEDGQLPAFDVDVADVDVNMKDKKVDVKVPDVDVKMKEKELTIPVPNVDIKMPEKDGPAAQGDTDPEVEKK